MNQPSQFNPNQNPSNFPQGHNPSNFQYPPPVMRAPASAGAQAYFLAPSYPQPSYGHPFQMSPYASFPQQPHPLYYPSTQPLPSQPHPNTHDIPPTLKTPNSPQKSPSKVVPQELKKSPTENSPVLNSSPSYKAAPLNYTPRVAGKWIEYKTADNKLYYYDSVLDKTFWEKPDDFELQVAPSQKAETAKNNSVSSFEIQSTEEKDRKAPKKRPKKADPNKLFGKAGKKAKAMKSYSDSFSLLSHEECVEMFKNLLKEQRVPHDAEWAGILSDIIKDRRYGAIRTLGERKKIFKEYCSEQKKRFRKASDEECRVMLVELEKILEDEPQVGLDSRFEEIEDHLENHEKVRKMKFLDKRTLFRKFHEIVRKKRREKSEESYQKNAPLFEALLKSDTTLSPRDKWEEVQKRYLDCDCVFKLREKEREKVFKRYVTQLEKQLRIEAEKRRNLCKTQDKNFGRLLNELSYDRTLLHSKTRWKELLSLPEFKNDERYKCMETDEKQREKAHKMFERFCCDLEDRLDRHKRSLKRFLRERKKRIEPKDEVDALCEEFEKDKNFPKMKKEYVRLLFLEMVAKARHVSDKKDPPKE